MQEKHPEKKPFKYLQDGQILDFQFVSEKKVKCPKCKKEYKNILLHLQKSSCRISNLNDLSEKFTEHIKVHLDKERKDDHRKWKANYRAKQRKVDGQKVLDHQNRLKQKSRLEQRGVNNQRVLEDQNKDVKGHGYNQTVKLVKLKDGCSIVVL